MEELICQLNHQEEVIEEDMIALQSELTFIDKKLTSVKIYL